VTNSTVSSTTWESSESWAAHSPTHLPDTPAGEARTFTVATANGTRIEADIWFRCHGTTPATGYLADELAAARTPDGYGYLEVTPQLQVVGFDRVYALGDIAAIDTNKGGDRNTFGRGHQASLVP
jgi:NADH dehydrogenase FAD-containing subunit